MSRAQSIAVVVTVLLAPVLASCEARGGPPPGAPADPAILNLHGSRTPGVTEAAARTDSPVIAIDPGHPSETSPGTFQHGVAEVHIAWLVALKLRDLLAAEGYRVVLTKTREGEMVQNRKRAETANRAGAALMVRLHCDATAGSGFALYHPDRKGTVQGVTGPSDTVITASRAAAGALHAGMAEVLGQRLNDGGIRGDSRTYVGSRQGALTGSIFSEVPIVTVEMVVLGARADAAFISSGDGQDLMARAIAAGIRRFVPVASDSTRIPGPQPGARGRPVSESLGRRR